ncbi:MAG: hypothetical protein HQL43_10150 [Alphaproteobacteria bacterium]|nr:hypothetical protein [Alphaproteobacteria bacterium]
MTKSKDEELIEEISRFIHQITLRIACLIVGRSYAVVSSFNSFREENFTILCSFAIILVCTLAFGTFYTAVDYILYDYVRPYVSGNPFELINRWKIFIPAFWAFAIYVIDMSILNGKKLSTEKEGEEGGWLLRIFRSDLLRLPFRNKTLGVRFILIICTAILSAMFLITRLNEQLISNSTFDQLEARTESEKINTAKNVDGINQEAKTLGEQRKALNDELMHLEAERKKVDIEKDREIATIRTNYSKKVVLEQEKFDTCEFNCAPIQIKIANLKALRDEDIRFVRNRTSSDLKEIEASKKDFMARLSVLDKEYNSLPEKARKEAESLAKTEAQLAKDATTHIERQKSFGALMRYMIDGADSGHKVSLAIFSLLVLFFAILDSVVLLLKFSYESLYDGKMDAIHETNKREQALADRIEEKKRQARENVESAKIEAEEKSNISEVALDIPAGRKNAKHRKGGSP